MSRKKKAFHFQNNNARQLFELDLQRQHALKKASKQRFWKRCLYMAFVILFFTALNLPFIGVLTHAHP